MNPDLVADPKYRELRQLIARLELISHVSGSAYDGRAPRATDDEPGGQRPPGGRRDRPRHPGPLPGSDALDSELQAYQERRDEWDAWLISYQRRTPEYFQRQLEDCHTAWRVEKLVTEARETLEAWHRQPMPRGVEPEFGSPQWKRWIAESSLNGGELARKFNVTRQYIYKIRRGYGA